MFATQPTRPSPIARSSDEVAEADALDPPPDGRVEAGRPGALGSATGSGGRPRQGEDVHRELGAGVAVDRPADLVEPDEERRAGTGAGAGRPRPRPPRAAPDRGSRPGSPRSVRARSIASRPPHLDERERAATSLGGGRAGRRAGLLGRGFAVLGVGRTRVGRSGGGFRNEDGGRAVPRARPGAPLRPGSAPGSRRRRRRRARRWRPAPPRDRAPGSAARPSRRGVRMAGPPAGRGASGRARPRREGFGRAGVGQGQARAGRRRAARRGRPSARRPGPRPPSQLSISRPPPGPEPDPLAARPDRRAGAGPRRRRRGRSTTPAGGSSSVLSSAFWASSFMRCGALDDGDPRAALHRHEAELRR